MGYRIDLVKHYYHPHTGKRLSQEKARLYMRRVGKRIRPQLWLTARHTLSERGYYLSDQQFQSAKKYAGRIMYAERLTRQEAILRATSLKEQKVRTALADHRVFSRLYEDFVRPGEGRRRGSIRVTVSGTLDGRRIREVIHLGFDKDLWEMNFRSDAHAKEGFKEWLVGAVLSNVRRRGLRLSDPRQSAERVRDLIKNRQGMVEMLDFTKPEKRGKLLQRIKWATDAIIRQKKSRELRGATIRIEKLV